MPRYYFHVRGPGERLTDDSGVVLPDSEAAWYQAVRSAREIIRANVHLGCPFDDHMIEIVDDRGAPVEHIPLADVARYAL
ncbi:MAG TPA: hypothetical protein VGD66_02570 [Allosphingosinicella sp.]|jgi:hypothetical protein